MTSAPQRHGLPYLHCDVMSSLPLCSRAILRDTWHRSGHLCFSWILLPTYVLNSVNFKRACPFFTGYIFQPYIHKNRHKQVVMKLWLLLLLWVVAVHCLWPTEPPLLPAPINWDRHISVLASSMKCQIFPSSWHWHRLELGQMYSHSSWIQAGEKRLCILSPQPTISAI